MPQSPDWKQLLETGMQFTELRRSQARALANGLVAQGQLARDQVSSTVDELVELSRRRSEDVRKLVQHEVSRQLGALGLATKADLARLERRLTKATRAAKNGPATKKSTTKKTAKGAKKTAGPSASARKAG
jgi:polyhydroxyalkanoate synthesis regulator phasin